ncbi:hypothetical protein BCD_1422 (plasmid) [Borrelia crocidurae DOU]|uniref:Uncharacterized protein n=1 Tax=Borrelia crocidurae DOU TaxID=1293575 RepID=W5SLD0_9SPIR|nr:hypothetical protein BCD_1422 [Borrelia crocidurae DOU]
MVGVAKGNIGIALMMLLVLVLLGLIRLACRF